jgi:hypothetical protein
MVCARRGLGDYDLGTGDRLPFLRPDKIKAFGIFQIFERALGKPNRMISANHLDGA